MTSFQIFELEIKLVNPDHKIRRDDFHKNLVYSFSDKEFYDYLINKYGLHRHGIRHWGKYRYCIYWSLDE